MKGIIPFLQTCLLLPTVANQKQKLDSQPSPSTDFSKDMSQAVQQLLDQHQIWKADHQAIVKKIDGIRCLDDNHNSDDGFPYLSSAVLLTGCSCLLRLIVLEYRNYNSKAASVDRGGRVSINEFLQYRLDFYFSSSQWAKPILLLGLSFIIILQATVVSILFNGDDLSGAIWKAWTHVADPGKLL